MRKITYLLLALLLGIVRGDAQNTIQLNGNRIPADANVAAVKQAYRNQSRKTNLPETFLVQFEKIPDMSTQKSLEQKGIRLLQYVSANTYFAEISPGFYSTPTGTEKLRSIITIKPEYKIDAALTKGNIPEYAKDKGGYLKVVITYFEQSNETQIKNDLEKMQVKTYRIMPSFHQISATIPADQLKKIASLIWVQNIELTAPPKKTNNREGRSMHRANILTSNALGIGYGLNGNGIRVGLWDTDVELARDFGNRVVIHEFEDHNPHGTHTCGTIAGAGIVDPMALGMAPEALIHAWNFNIQSNGLTVQEEREISIKNDNLDLTSNSWGYLNTSCPNPFTYNFEDRAEDMLACRYPYFLYVFSAGNDQGACANGFYTTSKNQKNTLVVAAADKNNDMSNFSSFGPSSDGRLIPNISGDGVHVYSNVYQNSYDYYNGTSMATPGVAGTMALLIQRYKNTRGGSRPLSAMMRALACNTATDFGNPGPDYKFGYGVINGMRAIEAMEKNQFFNDSVGNAGVINRTITIPAGAIGLRVMLAWNDKEGTPGASKILVNDLDLKVISNGNTTLPWILNPASPNANAIRGVDTLNNMEQVTLDNPAAGTYTIRVSGSMIPAGMQSFSVVYDVVMPQLKMIYPIGGENFNPGDHQVIRWDCEGYNKPFTLEYSSDNGVNYVPVATNIPANARSFEWTVPGGAVANGRFRVSTGSVVDVCRAVFSIEATPTNVSAPRAACGVNNYTLRWDSVPNATYKVYKLNNQSYQLLGTASTNSYALTGLTPGNDNYFCVRAIDKTNGAVSERSVAWNIPVPATVASFPYFENFNKQKADNMYMSHDMSTGFYDGILFINSANAYVLQMTGPPQPFDSAWKSTATTPAQAFTLNPDYVVKAGICKIDASSMAGKKMLLQFDYRQKYKTSAGTSYFRVKINGNYPKNTDSVDIYGASNTDHFTAVSYDISSYAGNANITLEFEGVFETMYQDGAGYTDDLSDFGDFVMIDNVRISEMGTDLAITKFELLGKQSNADTVRIVVKNLSGNPVSNIPVRYKVNNLPAVNDTLRQTLPSLGSALFSFAQKLNLSANGIDTITASVNYTGDQVPANNAKTIIEYVDHTSLRMGSSPLASTCGAVFTDARGVYQTYDINEYYVMTIKPDSVGKLSKIDFLEFETEQNYDFLTIYDGPDNTYPVLGSFSGQTLPPSFTASSRGGELTFEFMSDYGVNYSGWKAQMSCVNRPLYNLAALSASMSGPADSTIITLEVANAGASAYNSYNVYYKADNNATVQQTVNTRLGPDSTSMISFSTKVNLSAPIMHAIKVWVKGNNDAISINDTVQLTYANYTDLSAVLYDIMPNRTAISEITGTISNEGDKVLDSITVAIRINNGTEQRKRYAWPGGSTSLDFSFTNQNFSAAGTYLVKAYTVYAGDINHSNDTAMTTVVKNPNAATNVVGHFADHDAMVVVNPLPSLNLRNNFTFECWAKLGPATLYGRLFEKGSMRMYYSINESVYPANSIIVNANTAAGGYTVYFPGVIKENRWQHFALTISSSNVITLYVDGVPNTAVNYSGTTAPASSNLSYPLYFGNRPTHDRHVDGYMDEVRIWNTAISQSRIQNNMYTDYSVTAADSNLVGYYKFNEGGGDYVYDYSSKDNTAYIMGADVSGIGAGKFWDTPGMLLDDVRIPGQRYPTTYNSLNNTFYITMRNANLTNLTASFFAAQGSVIRVGSTIQSSGATANNFTNPVIYTATGTGINNGITQSYTVRVVNEIIKDSACDLTAFWFDSTDNAGKPILNLVKEGSNYNKKMVGFNASSLKARFNIPATAKLYIDDVAQTSPQTSAMNYSKPVFVKIVAEDGVNMKFYAINFDGRNNQAQLFSMNIPRDQVGSTIMDTTAHTAVAYVKPTTDLRMISPAFTASAGASAFVGSIRQMSGVSLNNFMSPVVYKIQSEDETANTDWTLNINPVVPVSSIDVTGQGGAITISTKGGTLQINATVLPGNATFKNVNWSVSNGSGAATISPSGLLKAVADGTVGVWARATDSSGRAGLLVVTIFNQTVGLAESSLNQIRVYPNPATGTLYIDQVYGENIAMKVYDLLGNLITEKTGAAYMNTIDISGLNHGVYILNLMNAKNELRTVKFIKE